MTDTLHIHLITEAEALLAEAEQALHKGLIQDAYALSLQATQLDPENGEAWLLRAGLTASLEEKILCINHMNELGLRDQDKHHLAFFALQEVLDRDPFLAYADETDELYRVHNVERDLLSIPKKRSVAAPYPPTEEKNSLTLSHQLLLFAALGLLFAGLGTLIFAPLAAWSALEADRSPLEDASQSDARVVTILAALLFIVATAFSILFFIHWIG